MTLPDAGIPLAETALIIACEEYPDLGCTDQLCPASGDSCQKFQNIEIGGQSGELSVQRASSTRVRIGELQVLITKD